MFDPYAAVQENKRHGAVCRTMLSYQQGDETMKLKICFLLVLAIGVAQAEDRAKPKKEAPKKKATPPAELTLPAGAKLVEPGTYTFTDAQGKKWIYRQTPFGLARAEDKPVEADPTTNLATTATEDGDMVRFE